MLRKRLIYIIAPGIIYFLLDIPIRMTGFANFGNLSGLKSFLPIVFGILFGPVSVPGMCLGAEAAALVAGSPVPESAAELLGILIMGCGSWFLWYLKNTEMVCLKKGTDYLRFTGIAVFLSAVSALPAFFMLGYSYWLVSALCSVSISIFVGIPVLILATSIFCIQPICPPWVDTTPDISCTIGADAAGLGEVCDRISDIYMEKKLPVKKAFRTQNCLEEFAVRIQAACGNCPVEFDLHVRDNVSMLISYTGERYNPLHSAEGEEREDLLGLVLIQQSALRASFYYSGRQNHLHIVI